MKLRKGIVFVLTALMTVSTAWANDTSSKPVLELTKAIDMAISKDKIIPQYSRNVTVYKEQKKAISDIASYKYNELTTSINEAEQNKIYRKDIIEKEVTEAYQNIVLYKKNIELLNSQIALNEKQVKQENIKKQKGYSSELDYEQVLHTLEDNKISKEEVENKLDDAKRNFLTLTNVNVDNYDLKVDAAYEPLVLDKNIKEYASSMATKLVHYKEQKVQNVEENFWGTIYGSGENGGGPTYASYLEGKLNVETSKEQAEAAYDDYKATIEAKYTAVNSKMNTIKQKAAEYATNSKQLKVLDIKYKAGYVSAIDYEKQKVELESEQFSYLSELYSYNILKIEIQKPWTFVGIGA